MKGSVFVWRLTLACGHLTLLGPLRDATHERYVGDHLVCRVCPIVKQNGAREFQYHLIVKVEVVDPIHCSSAWLEVGLGD